MSSLFGNHIVGFPMRRLVLWDIYPTLGCHAVIAVICMCKLVRVAISTNWKCIFAGITHISIREKISGLDPLMMYMYYLQTVIPTKKFHY